MCGKYSLHGPGPGRGGLVRAKPSAQENAPSPFNPGLGAFFPSARVYFPRQLFEKK